MRSLLKAILVAIIVGLLEYSTAQRSNVDTLKQKILDMTPQLYKEFMVMAKKYSNYEEFQKYIRSTAYFLANQLNPKRLKQKGGSDKKVGYRGQPIVKQLKNKEFENYYDY